MSYNTPALILAAGWNAGEKPYPGWPAAARGRLQGTQKKGDENVTGVEGYGYIPDSQDPGEGG